MTINNNTTKTAGLQFKELCVCDVFLHGGRVYVKAIESFDEEGTRWNAFCLGLGTVECFEDYEVVIPVNACIECN